MNLRKGKQYGIYIRQRSIWQDIDRDTIMAFAKKTKAILTVEENTKIGGLYSAVSEVLSESFPVPIMSISIKDKFGIF
jgi:transketolase